jgi:signal transduction histidine kinase
MGKTEQFLLSIVLATTAFVIFVGAIVYFVIAARRRRLMYIKEKQAINEMHVKELLTKQLEIQQLTMQEIGREIHDSIGQKLTLASLYAQQLSHQNEAPAINHKIGDIGQIINESLQELRSLSKSLTGTGPAQEGDLRALLEVECTRIGNLGICNMQLESNSEIISVQQPGCNVLLRIVQEFFQNSLKHAQCSNINIILHQGDEGITICVKDNGQGFDIEKIEQSTNNGIGLQNMKRRAELVGATLKINSRPGDGTMMEIKLVLDTQY